MTFKNILVPVDFSETSDRAVDYALFLAAQYRAKVTLFHAVVLMQEDIDEEEHLKAYEAIIEKKEEKRKKYMKTHTAKGERLGVRIDSVLMRGFTPGETILNYVDENKYDVIMMGTHGRTELMKWWLGSVAEKIVRYSHIPVITIHKDFKKNTIKKVLFPLDLSQSCKKAVKAGMSIVRRFDAKPMFMFAIEEEDHPLYYLHASEAILKTNPQLKERLMKSMIACTGVPKDKGTYHLLEGKAHKQIETFAENKKIDLIIMAKHGMSGWEHFLIGSTTERVVSVAPCPVLTIPVRDK